MVRLQASAMKLITWNTQWCCGLDGTVSPQRIVDGARALGDFDVLCLQEVAQGFDGLPGAPGDQPAQLAALLPGFQCFFGAAVDEFLPDGRRQRFGNLVATRLPVARVQHHALPWPADGDAVSMPRMCTVVTVLSPLLGAVRVMTTHLEYYSARQRLAQAQSLRALHDEACALATAPPQPCDDGSPFQAKRAHAACRVVRRLQRRSHRCGHRGHRDADTWGRCHAWFSQRLGARARQHTPRADLSPVRHHLW